MLMSSYSQLMALPQGELRKHAKDAGVKNYSNLSKHDLAEATISASSLHVKSEPGRANAAEEIALPSTPEGRGGRARSPHRAPHAAAASAAVAASEDPLQKDDPWIATAAVSTEMSVDDFGYLAFIGFDGDFDRRKAYELIREYVHDFFGLHGSYTEVIGVHTLEKAVCLRFPQVRKDLLEKLIFEKRDSFLFNGKVLSTEYVDPSVSGCFVVPSEAARGSAPLLHGQVPAAPAGPRPSAISPVIQRHKHAFKEFFDKGRPQLPAMETIPPLPFGEASNDSVSSAGQVVQPLVEGMNLLVAGINEMRSALNSTVKLQDLQDFRELQAEELKTMVTTATEPLRQDIADHHERISGLETDVRDLKANSGESERKKMLDAMDPAFKQIAFTGFKDSGSVADTQKRIKALKEFASVRFGHITVANIEIIMNGPWKQRKPTNTVIMEFFSRDARDQALEVAKSHPVTIDGVKVDVKIERARTRSQRARNWALRKAEELAKIEATRLGVHGVGRIDFEMPIRRVKVGDVVVFEQQRDELRGRFVGVFSSLVLPL